MEDGGKSRLCWYNNRPMDKISFSKHASDQMAERKISKVAILRSVRNPDKLQEQESARFRAMKKFGKAGHTRLLVVVYDKVEGGLRIVTAFFTSQIQQYL